MGPGPGPVAGRERARRSILSVPASNPRFVARAATTEADAVLFDLEDSVAPARKVETRALIVRALNETDFGPRLRLVRVNALGTPWAVRDVVDLVEGAGANVDAVLLPKTDRPEDVAALDVILTGLEAQCGLTRRIGVEAQIESARGLANAEAIARASPRLEALVFGPGDFAASMGMPLLSIGAVDAATDAAYPGHLWHYAIQRIVVAARAAGLQAVNGPYGRYRDLEGLRRAATLDFILGMDGKWAVHPTQVPVLNEVFSPPPALLEQARALLDRYRRAVDEEGVGAVAFGDEMIDEASRKLAEALLRRVERGRNAGPTAPTDAP